jgi:rubrerythrin
MNHLSTIVTPSRRSMLKGVGVLSAGAVLMLAGVKANAQTSDGDTAILNVALALEHEAIAAYQLGATSGLLQKPVLDVALRFQADHKAHRDALMATIAKMGGQSVKEKTLEEYAKSLNAGAIKDQADILMLAARLEMGAINAYLGVIPAFKDSQLAKIAGRLAADETMHWALLNNALGRALPNGALSFGA